jgi:hypothetical protein
MMCMLIMITIQTDIRVLDFLVTFMSHTPAKSAGLQFGRCNGLGFTIISIDIVMKCI